MPGINILEMAPNGILGTSFFTILMYGQFVLFKSVIEAEETTTLVSYLSLHLGSKYILYETAL
jgi:hypothetical protein